MNREILINSDGGETRVAVVEDGRLVELTVERPEAERVAGNVYKAKVENVLPGMQAAFVNIGLEKNAFLYVADAAPVINLEELEGDAPPKIRKGLAINKLLKPGQKITVQVTKDPIGTKGARVSAYVTLPSHYVVLMPTVDYVGVSRRIGDSKERARLRAMAGKIKPRGMGLIVRTAADGHEFEEIEADVTYLHNLWRQIQTRSKSGTAPRVLHQDLGLVGRVVRDVLNESVTRLIVDSADEYMRVKDLLDAVAPTLKDRIELHERSAGELFAVHGIEAELDRALARRVWLKNGGYLVVDETEAFTVFDVNTGRYVGSTSLAQTVLDTNLEAAMEIARQLRLRDIGGIIIIDFIDMDHVEHRQRVLSRFDEHLRRDRTRSHVLGLTELGLLEMTRKKVRQSLGDTLTRICPTCEGRGRVLSEETVAARVRREIRDVLRSSTAHAIMAEIHPTVAALMTGAGSGQLRELERSLGKTIYVRGSEELAQEGFRFRLFDSQAEVQAVALPVQVGDVVELRVEGQHVSNRRDGIARINGFVLDIEDGGERVGERVKIEVVTVHRTFARARIIGQKGIAGRQGPKRESPPDGGDKRTGKPPAPVAAAVQTKQPAAAASKPPAVPPATVSAPKPALSTSPPQVAHDAGSDKAKVAAQGDAQDPGPETADTPAEAGASSGSRRSRSRRRRGGKSAQAKAEANANKEATATDASASAKQAAEGDEKATAPDNTPMSAAKPQGKGGGQSASGDAARGQAAKGQAKQTGEPAAQAKVAAPKNAAVTDAPDPSPAAPSSEDEVAAAAEAVPAKRKSRRRRPRRKKPGASNGDKAAGETASEVANGVATAAAEAQVAQAVQEVKDPGAPKSRSAIAAADAKGSELVKQTTSSASGDPHEPAPVKKARRPRRPRTAKQTDKSAADQAGQSAAQGDQQTAERVDSK